ncbi:MAG: hypothetical protein GY814_01765 [Gammaproteobacteria bacterium]|nr:hypothetical protein [Gammaproteobacteria bacterium]
MSKDARIKELEAQCKAMMAELAKLRTPTTEVWTRTPEVWTPPNFGPYSINGNLTLRRGISRSDRNAVGNSFKTKNSAQPAQRILRNAFMLDAYRRKFDPNAVQDWSDKEQQKYYPLYDHSADDDPWHLSFNSSLENPLQVYINKYEGQKLVDKLNAETAKLKLQEKEDK